MLFSKFSWVFMKGDADWRLSRGLITLVDLSMFVLFSQASKQPQDFPGFCY